ncbi:TolC family protein [Croceicoccus sp. F390]|uniref:TolC family protein n=1 Tax=Croceicoccus esteveae TaxID=3075597 RepID=A0ABU2ZLJ1_9SPHN|nr:TolC family protein [Croceicoccus sp. F390]MDT0577174.1 TolC family protein [Croceicoccus sp. F390]
MVFKGGVAISGLMLMLVVPTGMITAQDVYGPPVPGDVAGAVVSLDPPAAVPDVLGATAWLAVHTYPSIRAAEATIQASGAEVRAAKWRRFPGVTVAARAGRDRNNVFSPELRINQPLWTGGRITGGIARAEAVQDTAEAQLGETVQDLTLQAVNAYYGVVAATRREEILKKSLQEHQRLVESMARRVEQEVSPRSDLELATSRTAQVRQQLSLTIAQRYTNLQRLAELTGRTEFELGPVPEYSPSLHHPPTTAAVVQALACDPTRRRLLAEADIAEAERKIAQGAILPRVGVQLSQDDDFGTRFGLIVSAQTEGGLSSLSAAEGARLRAQASDLQISVVEREIREQIVLDVVENTTSAGTIESSSVAALATEQVTESFVRQFITGRRTWLDVMNAVREGTSAELTLVDAQITAMASAARLLLRTCEWRPDLMGADPAATGPATTGIAPAIVPAGLTPYQPAYQPVDPNAANLEPVSE